MKTLRCADLGAKDCSYTAKGQTVEEVVGTMMKHANTVHKEKMDAMSEAEKKGMPELMRTTVRNE